MYTKGTEKPLKLASCQDLAVDLFAGFTEAVVSLHYSMLREPPAANTPLNPLLRKSVVGALGVVYPLVRIIAAINAR